jgi:hypothetical protein
MAVSTPTGFSSWFDAGTANTKQSATLQSSNPYWVDALNIHHLQLLHSFEVFKSEYLGTLCQFSFMT